MKTVCLYKEILYFVSACVSADLFAADDVTCEIYAKRVRDARVGLVPKIFGKARESIFSAYIYKAVQHIE